MSEKRKDEFDWYLVISISLIVSASVLTLNTQEANQVEGIGRWAKQLGYGILGLFVMYFMSRFNYLLLASYSPYIYAFSLLLLVLTLIPGIGYLPSGRGARSWLKVGPIAFQASEFSKLATVIVLGHYLQVKEREMQKLENLIIPFIIVLIPMLLIILQPDFGTAIGFLPILLAMLFLGGSDLIHIFSIIIFGAISLFIPLYLEFSRLTLLGPLTDYLRKEGKTELLNLVNQAGGKIWAIMDGKSTKFDDIKSFKDPRIISSLQEASDRVIEDYGSIAFKILSNENLMISAGVVLIVMSLVLVILKMTQGSSDLRKFYVPVGILGISLICAVLVNKTIPFRENQVIRLTAFLNPEQFRQGAGYQLRASLPAVGSGKFFGKGLYHGEMTEGKTPHVPEAGTDFIFASWAEQTGFIGSAFLLFLYAFIPLRGLQISYESKERFGAYLASGIVALIFFHIVINVGIVLGLMPITGLPLTFMSYGGSHLIIMMMAMGILQSIKMRKHAN
jgi:rod shape determining protein RodA